MNREIDIAHPERYPDIFVRTKCAVCDRCWLDTRSRRCLFGGPYAGYEEAKP